MSSVQSKSIEAAGALSFSSVLGIVPILTGESADSYQASLDALIWSKNRCRKKAHLR